jgi:hypothetical protein
MKLILDFDKPLELKITSTDDDSHFYLFTWMATQKKCSLWYDNKEFVWEKEYDDLEIEIATVLIGLLSGMKSKEWEKYVSS